MPSAAQVVVVAGHFAQPLLARAIAAARAVDGRAAAARRATELGEPCAPTDHAADAGEEQRASPAGRSGSRQHHDLLVRPRGARVPLVLGTVEL